MSTSVLRCVTTLAAVAITTVAGTAQPVAAQAQLSIVGTVRLNATPTGPAGNVILDFVPPTGGGGGIVNAFGPQSGVFASMPPLTPGFHVDLVSGPLAVPPPTLPPLVIMSIGGFTFTAGEFTTGTGGTPLTLTYDGASTFGTLSVLGTVVGPGLVGQVRFLGAYSTQFPDQTPADVLTAIRGPGVTPRTLSATFTLNPVTASFATVPEPSTYALMATGLVALLGVARRRQLT